MQRYRPFISRIIVYSIFALLVIGTLRFPFFWDTIQLGSNHAFYFYETDFRSIILPNEIDSGHIPLLGMYLAVSWVLFGKSLMISHLIMLPFVLGIVYQSFQLCRKLFPEQWNFPVTILLLADATLLAQCSLISPDVILMFFFIMAINHWFSGKRIWFALALTGMALASMRGMMCVAAFGIAQLADCFLQKKNKEVNLIASFKILIHKLPNMILVYLPAIILTSLFLGWHYMKTGWIGYHTGMPWYPLFEKVDFMGALYNVGILCWRMIDFGRLFVWIAAVFCLVHFLNHKPKLNNTFQSLIILFVCIFLVLSYAVVFHKNLSGHRYLLPAYYSFALIVFYYVFHFVNIRWGKTFIIIILFGLLSGNFWVYPDTIAKGWDSTLAYLPYPSLRNKMMEYMQQKGIKLSETGTAFPNHGKLRYLEISENTDSFDTLNLSTNKYVFYSNVFNDFSDEELKELSQTWKKIMEYQCIQVRVTLYKKPE
jgi:hypothetical protein